MNVNCTFSGSAGFDRLESIAALLRDGGTAPPVTVRDFLGWFGAQRRGYSIVSRVREALKQSSLCTNPDFEAAFIDSPISFYSATTPPHRIPVEDAGLATETRSVGDSGMVSSDPTYRISKLAAANKEPIWVAPDATCMHAVTLMLMHDFSQLPVMTNTREVKGVISWRSIGSRLAIGKSATFVRDLMDPAHEIKADSSLFVAISTVVQHQYVLVRGGDKRISGIVTASDLSLQFQQLAEPFLLLEEIENHIRQMIGERFTVDELQAARDPSAAERKVDRVADLTFGGYIRLLEEPNRWSKLRGSVDRSVFCAGLERVRGIRNDVLHFDPDGIPSEDLEALRDFVHFLQRLKSLGAS